MSNMSRWLGPPNRFTRMIDLALGVGFPGPLGGRLEQARQRHRAEEREPSGSQYLAPAGAITGWRHDSPGFVAWQPRLVISSCHVIYRMLNIP